MKVYNLVVMYADFILEITAFYHTLKSTIFKKSKTFSKQVIKKNWSQYPFSHPLELENSVIN